jgi:hypothetical protein
LIFVFNAESPTNIAVQNETEEGIIHATAGYPVTINCSVNSGLPNETMIWNYNNTVVAVGGPAFISYTFTPARKDHLQNTTVLNSLHGNITLCIYHPLNLKPHG